MNLPWELLYSPKDLFLAPKLSGMYRTLSHQKVRAEMPELPRDQLNILLVIARPYEQDVGFQTIARPMLDALRPLQKFVNLKVLRPPSFTEFEKELNANRQGFYHIVHFDGHGSFNPNAGRQFNLMDASGQGELVFETLEGKAEVVSADRIAQSLTDCRVPVFVLNACKSAQEGEEEFTSVATRFIFAGAKGVVAMAYSVHAEAAKHFMARFYGELVGGASLSTAVAAARISVLNQPERLSPRGQRTLKDWLVPVLYQQEAYTPFTSQNPTLSFADLMAEAEQEEQVEAQATNLPDAGTYGFVGRSAEILVLERAFRQNNVVLLKGMGGVGKTQLALGFARWLAETQGRDDGIFFTSFEQGATLSNVVNEIGRQLGGERFAQLMTDQQEQIVLEYLKTKPCLLIWDNFEPVAGFPAGNQPLLPDPERQRLQQWLKALRGGKSWVLITSRREEPWLDCGYRLVPLAGLSRPNSRYPGLSDSEALATKILQTVNVELKDLAPEYLELLKLLGGHPLSLRVVLPHLQRQTPAALIEALRQGLDTFAGAEEEGREKSLTVSLDYSFTALSERTRQHLPFLALFSERVDADWLHLFSSDPENEWGQVYRAVFGENLQKTDWIAIFQEAAAASIVESLGSTIFQIHPALPWYLRQRLSQQAAKVGLDVADGGIANLEKKLLSFYGGLADYYREQLISNAEAASFVLRVEEPNLLQQLRLAEQQEDWGNAQSLLQALGELFERIGRKAECRALWERGLAVLGHSLASSKSKGKAAFEFWMYIRGEDAKEKLLAAQLDDGAAILQEILDELNSLDDSSINSQIASISHNLGYVAEEQRRFDDAIALYQKSLKICEDAGDLYSAARDYHHLGIVAQEQRRFDDAIAFYQKSLKIKEDAGDLYSAASDYHQLGIVAQKQRRFDDAIAFYQKISQNL
ncbi:CHAT domain-containing protein [Acaryochloris sp. 'Moss Beach']|uniref:CHAT domain-containing protein n=1 Tax=Acaryochloris sp. 'Moss Beach' TaxID=2740837 RepID=UPI001F2E6F94|nr:CHAT domain-containing protein [Acaryochloris sp. 'Moss Beach']UJB69113.1 CHAT domain-containing protein [Acaryochloris sp. 'Moss Beach']